MDANLEGAFLNNSDLSLSNLRLANLKDTYFGNRISIFEKSKLLFLETI